MELTKKLLKKVETLCRAIMKIYLVSTLETIEHIAKNVKDNNSTLLTDMIIYKICEMYNFAICKYEYLQQLSSRKAELIKEAIMELETVLKKEK